MDAGIADTINRQDASRVAEYFDKIDKEMGGYRDKHKPWYYASMAGSLMGENSATNADRAWLVGQFAARVPGLRFDGAPADGDWDNLFSHFRAEILTRRDRDPRIPHAEDCLPNGVV